MDVKVINPFLNAVTEVVSRMTQIVVSPGEIYLKDHPEAVGDLTGFIPLSGIATGGFSMSMPNHLARTLVGAMLGRKITVVDDEVMDEIGELTAQISRQALAVLEDRGYSIVSDVPRMLVGKGHQVPHARNSPVLAIPFKTLYGDLHVEISLSI